MCRFLIPKNLRAEIEPYLLIWIRRQDSSIGFGAPIRTNMRSSGASSPMVTSSLVESVRVLSFFLNQCQGTVVCVSKVVPHIFINWIIHLHWQVESGDLVRYGLIPEFIGRLPILVSLAALNEGQLVQVAPANAEFSLLLYSMLLTL